MRVVKGWNMMNWRRSQELFRAKIRFRGKTQHEQKVNNAVRGLVWKPVLGLLLQISQVFMFSRPLSCGKRAKVSCSESPPKEKRNFSARKLAVAAAKEISMDAVNCNLIRAGWYFHRKITKDGSDALYQLKTLVLY